MDTTHPRPPRPRAPSRGPAPLRRRRDSGFTLVEVMAASVVLVLAITSSIVVMQSGFRDLDTARKTTLAAQIMQSEMEKIRMMSSSRVEALIAGGTSTIDLTKIFPQNTETEKRILSEMERCFTTRQRTVGYLSGSDNEIYVVDIVLGWKGLDGQPHRRSSSTRYCKNGLYTYYYTLNKKA